MRTRLTRLDPPLRSQRLAYLPELLGHIRRRYAAQRTPVALLPADSQRGRYCGRRSRLEREPDRAKRAPGPATQAVQLGERLDARVVDGLDRGLPLAA